MTKAFVTLAVGPHEELLDIAEPSFEEFCIRHDYDLLIAGSIESRPAAVMVEGAEPHRRPPRL